MKQYLLATTVAAILLAASPGLAWAQPALGRPGTPEGPGFGASPAAPTSPEGQTAVPNLNTTGDQTLPQVSVPTTPPPRIGLFPEFGDKLLNAGIDFHGIAFDHFLANPTAGSVPGQTNNLFVFRPAADFDLQKLVGIPGGNVHLGLSFFGLRADIPQIITQAGGVMTGFQTTPSTQTNLLSVLTYEQRFLDGRLSIEAGRTNVYNYFLLPNSLDPFTHFSSTFQVVGDFNSNPYPVWGGRATYRITPTWYVQAGAFEDTTATPSTTAIASARTRRPARKSWARSATAASSATPPTRRTSRSGSSGTRRPTATGPPTTRARRHRSSARSPPPGRSPAAA